MFAFVTRGTTYYLNYVTESKKKIDLSARPNFTSFSKNFTTNLINCKTSGVLANLSLVWNDVSYVKLNYGVFFARTFPLCCMLWNDVIFIMYTIAVISMYLYIRKVIPFTTNQIKILLEPNADYQIGIDAIKLVGNTEPKGTLLR